ncbi:sensor histidine kinase [Pustulibacterium marinum]|nr:histidine kinase [Pustulibacterium marinum]
MPNLDDDKAPPFSLILYVQIISFIIPVLFSVALKIAERYIKTEAERKDAENVKLESELQHLRYQLQPHFFFNSLNNIYSLVDISPDKAKSTIHSLSKLMRYLLYETTTEKVSLKHEIQFMEKYIELMKLRLSDKTNVEVIFPEIVKDVKIAPLLFISLVENAFKHGVSANHVSIIYFEMKLQQNTITFTTENPNFPKATSDKSGSGIGLKNLEQRLKLIYPKQHQLEYGVKGDVFVTELTVETE